MTSGLQAVTTYATAVIFGVCLIPGIAAAQTSQADLQAQIEVIKQQINQLQSDILEKSNDNAQTTDDESESSSLTNGASFVFTTNLSRGDQNSDVKRLQQALNQLLPTPVASSGPGSVGQETTFFGARTAAAVERFQEMHAEDVLAPDNLQQGTGYVGQRTRAKLNHLLALKARNNSSTSSSYQNDANNNASSYINTDDDADISELESQITFDKWELTEDEKRKIAQSVPESLRAEYFPEYTDRGGGGQYETENTDSSNPLQQEYQRRLQQQSSAVKELKKWSLSNMVSQPSAFLQRSLAAVFGEPKTVSAQGFLVFGGRITVIVPCTCNPPAIQFTVVGARPGSMVYFPGVTQKSPPTPPAPGAGTIGNYSPFGICLVGVPPACAPTPAFGTPIIMGTSY